jgi:uncharacterized protein
MRILRRTLLAGAFALVAAAAAAQQAPLSPPAQAIAPTTTLSPSHLAAAREVVTGSGLARTFEGMVPQIADQIRAQYSRTRPEIIKDMEDALRPIVAQMSSRTDAMIVASAELYAQRIPEPELKEIAAFFKSAAGQRYVNSQGQILNELFSAMQVFSQTLGNVMIDALREDLRKKNIQL